ncbi:MAG TPA: hypothetical protein VJB88_02650 [Vicinamibacteria bacterium]|nr:hypothetical protein [Vicinamibacteria bacterium]
MKTRIGRFGSFGFLLASVVLAVSGSVMAKDGKRLNRSLYVPIAFRSCEHLTKATLYIGDQPVASLPTERVFLFTYYPDLKRLEPAVTEIRIEGVRSDDATPFIGRLAVDPTAIYSAEERIELDFERAKKQLSYRIDSRYQKVSVLVRCSAECGKHDPAIARVSLPTTAIEESR